MEWGWKCPSSFKISKYFRSLVVFVFSPLSLLSDLVNQENENISWWLPWWDLDMVVVTNKWLFCLIPFAVYHFPFHFSFPRCLAAFSSGLSAQHPVLSVHQDVSHCLWQNYRCPLPGRSGGWTESQPSSNKEKWNVNVSENPIQNAACSSENSVAQFRLDASSWLDYHKLCTFFSVWVTV